MKKYMVKATIIASILTLIAGVCAALIAGMNLLTAPVIEKNNLEKKEKLCKKIYETIDLEASTIIADGFASSDIEELILAYDTEGNFLGFVYTVNGSNAYGQIKLLLGISQNQTLEGVEFITNGQSFSTEAEKHLNHQYHEDMTLADINNLNLKDQDVTAGATYASKLIRSLMNSAFLDVKNRPAPGGDK